MPFFTAPDTSGDKVSGGFLSICLFEQKIVSPIWRLIRPRRSAGAEDIGP